VECWGGARFLEAPSIEERDEYVRDHPDRRCFVVDNGDTPVELRP
jgi:hypothetical protein